MKKVCRSCRKPFEPVSRDQDECTQCMIRPSRRAISIELMSQAKEEGEMSNVYVSRKEKVCAVVGCEAVFIPTSNVQKYCPNHSKKVQRDAAVKKEVKSGTALRKSFTKAVPQGEIASGNDGGFFMGDRSRNASESGVVLGVEKASPVPGDLINIGIAVGVDGLVFNLNGYEVSLVKK